MEIHPKSSRPRNHIWVAILTLIILIVAVCFGIQFYTKTGVFGHSGKLVFDENVTEVVTNFVSEAISGTTLSHDVNIIAERSNTLRQDVVNEVLYNILVPVTNLSDSTISIPSSEVDNYQLISIWELTPEQKLLAIDDQYYLDTLNSGAIFEYLKFSSQKPACAETISKLVATNIEPFPTNDEVLSLAQTGVTALSRKMTAKLQSVSDATYFSEQIKDFLGSFDLTHTSNEASFSDLANTTNICSPPSMIDVLTDVGIDIIELTGNHNQDCGDQAAIDTIELYHQLGIQTFGGGKTLADASVPLRITEKGTNITLIGYNESTGGTTQDDTPGANPYSEQKAIEDIETAKARGDFVIVDVQYYECSEYASEYEDPTCDAADSAAGDQIGFFRHLIDLGADLVVGTSAHQPQTFETYHGKNIYYGLGNLFFDQSWWPGTTRSLVLVHYFMQGKLVQTRIVPTVYDQNYQTKLMDTQDAELFLERLLGSQPEQ